MAENSTGIDQKVIRQGPPALAGDYLRSFTGALRKIDAFNDFFDALAQVVREDTYFAGSAELVDYFNHTAGPPDFETMDDVETVVSVTGAAGNAGYLRYSGRRDGQALGAEDLHLMGAIAGFIAVLTAQADKFRKLRRSDQVLQYLVDQLPLGVVCFASDGGAIVENTLASAMLGDSGMRQLSELSKDQQAYGEGSAQLHMEADGRLLYCEGHFLKMDEETGIMAFVVQDLSGSRDKLFLDLEREAYRVESRGGHLTLALLEMKSTPGDSCRLLQSLPEDSEIDTARIQLLDAHTCVCLFPGEALRVVRQRFRSLLKGKIRGLNLSLISDLTSDSDALAEDLIEKARKGLKPASTELRPACLVMDPYPAVAESLAMMTSGLIRIQEARNPAAAMNDAASGIYDGIFLDVDGLAPEQMPAFKEALADVLPGMLTVYTTHKQPSMIREEWALGEEDIVFQKPFNAGNIRDVVEAHFNLA